MNNYSRLLGLEQYTAQTEVQPKICVWFMFLLVHVVGFGKHTNL